MTNISTSASTFKDIIFKAQNLRLHHSGVLEWVDQNIAVVSDLHLEKASHFAARGQFLPPHDSTETLTRLLSALQKTECDTVIFLGDSFHDVQGLSRLSGTARENLANIQDQYKIIWVTGNHDPDIGTDPQNTVSEFSLAPLIFRHEASIPLETNYGEVSGHYHPKFALKNNRGKITKPCFVVDEQRLIVPAFGTFTGGMDVEQPPLSALFKNPKTIYMLGETKLYTVPLKN